MQGTEPFKDQVCQKPLKYHRLFSCYQILPPLSQFCHYVTYRYWTVINLEPTISCYFVKSVHVELYMYE